MTQDWPELRWNENGTEFSAPFMPLRPSPPPSGIVPVRGRVELGGAIRDLRAGKAVLWRGDWPSARKFLTELTRRIGGPRPPADASPKVIFDTWRQRQAERALLLGRVLVPLENGEISLARAQPSGVSAVLSTGLPAGLALMPLRDVLAAISSAEWRKNGVPVAALGGRRIHPHYGVFPPTRQDYIDLVAQAPLPADTRLAFDIGTGTGVLAAVLLSRGVQNIVATDNAPRAIACAADNVDRLGLSARVTLLEGPLFPPGRAPLIVCNPPWLPAPAGTSLESAVYDPDSAMLRAFLSKLGRHLTPEGEAWLILSDLAEHLDLRAPGELQAMFAASGLVVRGRLNAPPSPKGAHVALDPLHFARAREVVSLWRLGTSQPQTP